MQLKQQVIVIKNIFFMLSAFFTLVSNVVFSFIISLYEKKVSHKAFTAMKKVFIAVNDHYLIIVT